MFYIISKVTRLFSTLPLFIAAAVFYRETLHTTFIMAAVHCGLVSKTILARGPVGTVRREVK